MRTNDVVITGPPRSGTTLTCELLNQAPNTVALDEPMDNEMWPVRNSVLRRAARRIGLERGRAMDEEGFIEGVQAFFASTRRSLLEGHGAISLQQDGGVTGSKFPDVRGESGLREDVTTRAPIAAGKELDEGFVLAVKHIAGFTAMLGPLKENFRCFAVVRNPLSTLSSWQTVAAPIRWGHAPRGEALDPDLRRTVRRSADVLDKQIAIMRWFFGSIEEHLKDDEVIRYEEIISSSGTVLGKISHPAGTVTHDLESRNVSRNYDRDFMRSAAAKVLVADAPWWRYYGRDEVEGMVRGL